MTDSKEAKRGPGRPRKWADNAERMRAYRARMTHERNSIKTGGTLAEMTEQIIELTRQRDNNWAQLTRLQQQIRTLKHNQPTRPNRELDNPDTAAETAFHTTTNTTRTQTDHTEIGRLEQQLLDITHERDDQATTIRRLEQHNTKLAAALTETTTTTAPPTMSRAQRRQTQRQAKRRQRQR